MSLYRKSLMAAAAGAALFASAAFAAVPADITADVYMRSGPGANYPVITALAAGERVEASCQPGTFWCQVNYRGTPGWVSAYYVATLAPEAPTYAQPAPAPYARQPIYPPAYIIVPAPAPAYRPPVYYPPAG